MPTNPFDSLQPEYDARLAELRAECPVAEVAPGMFYVTRHAEVVAAALHPATFQQGFLYPRDGEVDPDTLHLGETNPPLHTAVRAALSSGLSAGPVKAWEPAVRAMAADLAERFADRIAVGETVDVVEALSGPLPASVIAYVAGIPEELHAQLRSYTSDYIRMTFPATSPEDRAEVAVRVRAFDERMRSVVAERRAMTNRPADLMTALVEATDRDGSPLSDEKVLTHLTKDVIVGGTDTTSQLIANLFHQLLSADGLWARVRNDRELVPVAVEESLRHQPVVEFLFRVAADDADLGGVSIAAGSTVALGAASANHDERAFPDPTRFDLDRGDGGRRHVGFGWGIHLCVGAPLARMEARLLLDAALDRVPALGLAPGAVYERIPSVFRGPCRLDVVGG